MHFPLSAHPTLMAPMPSRCSGSSLCTLSIPYFADAALNTIASYTVSVPTLRFLVLLPHPSSFPVFCFIVWSAWLLVWWGLYKVPVLSLFVQWQCDVVCMDKYNLIKHHDCSLMPSGFERIVLIPELIFVYLAGYLLYEILHLTWCPNSVFLLPLLSNG